MTRSERHPEEDGPALLRRILSERRSAWERIELSRLAAGGKLPKGEAWKRRYLEPLALADTDWPTLPGSWAWASLDQITGLITSGSRAWSPYYGRGAGTFIMAQNVRPGRFTPVPRQLVDPPANDPERERTRVKRDDILVTIVGANTGNACRVNADLTDNYVCQSVGLLRPVVPELAAFIETYMTSSAGGQAAFKQVMYGAGRPHLSFDQLRALPIPIPPLSEQSQIAVELSNHVVDDGHDEICGTGSERRTTDLRRSILHAAFSGRLVPQDPADEPAATLLAHVCADATQPAPSRRSNRAGARR